MTLIARNFHAFVLLACLGTAATAQTPPAHAPAPAPAPVAPTPAPVATDPTFTTASFGDWILRCQKIEHAGLPPKLCEVSLSIQLQGQTGTFAQIAIGGLPKQPQKMTIALPPNIALPGSVKLSLGDKGQSGLELGWRRCLPTTCVAEGAIKDDILRAWRTGATGQIAFTDAAGRDIKVTFTLRGLAQALDAFAKS